MTWAWRLCCHAASVNLVYPLNLSLPGKQSINALLNQSLLAQDVRGVCLEELGDAIKDRGAGLKKARAYLAVLQQERRLLPQFGRLRFWFRVLFISRVRIDFVRVGVWI